MKVVSKRGTRSGLGNGRNTSAKMWRMDYEANQRLETDIWESMVIFLVKSGGAWQSGWMELWGEDEMCVSVEGHR